jgi:hypothetical protein
MIRVTKEARKHRWKVVVVALSFWSAGIAHAETVEGTWKFASSGEYFGDKNLITPLATQAVQATDDKLVLSPSCAVRFRAEPYAYSMVFQGLLREKVRADQLNKYLGDKFGFDLRDVKTGYKVEKSQCANGLQEVFVVGDDMLAVASNTIFYAFKRDGIVQKLANLGSDFTQKITPLPFDLNTFQMRCAPAINRIKGVPQTTDKCAPVFYPYVTSKNDKDIIGKLVGHHHYLKGDPKNYNGYDDPVSNNFHPVYMLLPPLKDITLVRVEDLEGGAEDRDIFSGAYLSIKNGAVVDQLDDGCRFLSDYSCVNDRGTKMYRLAESGKFIKY